MAEPTTIEISHTLGREEARRRVTSRIGELGSHLPGNIADVKTSWLAENRIALEIKAMGQVVSATIDIEDRVLRVSFTLPGMLSFFSKAVAAAVKEKGGQLLLPEN
jgi:hypothetical protein